MPENPCTATAGAPDAAQIRLPEGWFDQRQIQFVKPGPAPGSARAVQAQVLPTSPPTPGPWATTDRRALKATICRMPECRGRAKDTPVACILKAIEHDGGRRWN